MIEKILSAIKTATGLDATPFDTELENIPAVVYEIYRVDMIQYRLTIRAISTSLQGANELADKIYLAIADFGDENQIKGIASIQMNGGGSLKDYETNTIQNIMYFDVRYYK